MDQKIVAARVRLGEAVIRPGNRTDDDQPCSDYQNNFKREISLALQINIPYQSPAIIVVSGDAARIFQTPQQCQSNFIVFELLFLG